MKLAIRLEEELNYVAPSFFVIIDTLALGLDR